jgi:hypothetical protein
MRSASWDLTFTDIDRTVSGGVSIRLLAPKQPHSMSAFRAISGAERTSDQMVATSLFDPNADIPTSCESTVKA